MGSFHIISTLYCLLFVSTHCLDITEEVFGNTSNHYLPAAFGDFNADKLTDMFIIEKLKNGTYVVKVLLSYSVTPFVRTTGPHCLFEKQIKSLVPSDFDGDGAMDVLVVGLTDGLYECFILWGDLNNLTCLEDYKSVATLKSQPLLVDYNGDMVSDLFGEGADGNRSFWIFNSQRHKPMRIPVEISDSSIEPLPPLTKSGGHAFVDLDKDLAADLWVSAEGHFELWPNADDFQIFEVIDHPKINDKEVTVIGQSSFMDIDMDGNIELVLPVCGDSSCEQSFIYVHEFANITNKWYNLKVNFKDENEVQWSFPSDKSSYLYTDTITLRIGDQNFDGFPDILVTLFNGNSPKVILLINSECKNDCEYPRTFIPKWNTFNEWTNSVMGTFFDFLEDGNLDVLLVNTTSDGKEYSLRAYKDPVGYDAMFLKVLVLTGVCYLNCPNKEIPYGTNLPGPSITYSMISADGGSQQACASQISQTGHFALQLPFTVFGLGRNWNFIDKLQVGIPLSRPVVSYNYSSPSVFIPSENVLSSTFSQIIPNSQLVIIPYPMDRPTMWITKLFITPSKAMIMTAGALIATCLFVGAVIAGLHIKEKHEDKQEKRQQAQTFHFDAM